MRRLRPFVRCCFLALCLGFALSLEAKPEWVYTTWVEDPATTLVVRWNSLEGDNALAYRKEGEKQWIQAEVQENPLFPSVIYLYTAELLGLKPDTVYQFKIGKSPQIYSCKTLPKAKKDLKFIIGGDVYQSRSLTVDMHKTAASYNPDFVVIGGDIAYAKERRESKRKKEIERWSTFFSLWEKHMKTKDGRLIPILVALGNHDLNVESENVPEDAYFSAFFRNKMTLSYQVLDIGDLLSLFLLDSDHGARVQGRQEYWLKEALEQRKDRPYKIPVYHIAAYPSVYPEKGKICKKIRKFWSPLFEQYGVLVAFENHNHAYKRTHKIKEGKVDPSGVLYMGDGNWGVPTRVPKKPKNTWYLEKSGAINSFVFLTLKEKEMTLQSVDVTGQIFDEVKILR